MQKKFTKEEILAAKKPDVELSDVELSEEALEAVAGGFSQQEWDAMTREEQEYQLTISWLFMQTGTEHCRLLD